MLESLHKCKNCYFYHLFVSPGDAPWAITLNVVWMEREFDTYTFSRCMCPSNYNRFWDRARYWWKNVIFHTPLHSRGSRRNSTTPFGRKKLEWLGYHMVKKFRRYLYSFWRNSRTWRTDTHTDRHTLHDGIGRAYAWHRGKNQNDLYNTIWNDMIVCI